MPYTISEMAKKTNLSPSTLRYYDKEGLLPFLSRSANGIRMFDEHDFELLTIIECLKQTGMPIKKIKDFINLTMQGDTTIQQRGELMRQRQKIVQTQIKQLKQTLAILNYKVWYYDTASQAGSCKIHDTLREKDIPKNLRKVYNKLKGR